MAACLSAWDRNLATWYVGDSQSETMGRPAGIVLGRDQEEGALWTLGSV